MAPRLASAAGEFADRPALWPAAGEAPGRLNEAFASCQGTAAREGGTASVPHYQRRAALRPPARRRPASLRPGAACTTARSGDGSVTRKTLLRRSTHRPAPLLLRTADQLSVRHAYRCHIRNSLSVSMIADIVDLDLAESKLSCWRLTMTAVVISAWMGHAACEEARWAVARQIANEVADEVGATEDDLAWAASVLGLDRNAGRTNSEICQDGPHASRSRKSCRA